MSYIIKVEVQFESSTWTAEVIRTRFSCPGLLDFLRNLRNMDEGSMGSDSMTLNSLEKLNSTDCSMGVLERLDF